MPYTPLPKPVVIGFFLIGVVSATLFRSMVIVNRFVPEIARLVWYIAVFGYIFFFGYRFIIARRRRKAVIKYKLIEQIDKACLDEDTSSELKYILQSLLNSREMYNYIFIFVMSLIAITTDIILSILHY